MRDTKAFAAEKPLWSWWHVVSTVAVFAALIAFTCLDIPWFARLPASILAGLVQVRLFVLYHDQQHGSILVGSRLGSLFFRLYGLAVLTPASIWKDSHDHHHRNNQRRLGLENVGSFPILSADAYREAGPGTRFLYRLSRHPLTLLCGYGTVFLYGFCIYPFIANPRNRLDAALSVAVHAGLLVGLGLFRVDVMLLAVVVPCFIASALGAYLFYAQHNFPAAKIQADENWDYVFAALHSSSHIRMNPILRWFTGNIGYHHVHHLNAQIPFYRLPEAMAAFTELQSPGTTSLAPLEVLRCLKLKLWDPARGRLISFREARESRLGAGLPEAV